MTRDGLGFEEVNQEVTGTIIISGTTIYGTTSVTSPLISATTISGTTFYQNSKGVIHSLSIGSGTATYGAKLQAGSGVLSSNAAWIVYPVAYTGVPSVISQNRSDLDAELHVVNGSLGVGSFYIKGTNASDIFSWIAIGI